jgi:hypothetical protein
MDENQMAEIFQDAIAFHLRVATLKTFVIYNFYI